MSETKPESSIDGRDRSLALADALLERARAFQPLSPAAHQRVTHRLHLSVLHRASSRSPWLRPVVVAAVLLFSGTSFGIAFNRLVMRPLRSSQEPALKDDSVPGGRARVRKNREGRRETLGLKGRVPVESDPVLPGVANTAAVAPAATPLAKAPGPAVPAGIAPVTALSDGRRPATTAPSAVVRGPIAVLPPATGPASPTNRVTAKTQAAAPPFAPATPSGSSALPARGFERKSGIAATHNAATSVRLALHSPVKTSPPPVPPQRDAARGPLEPPPANTGLSPILPSTAPVMEPPAATEELLLATALRTLRVEHNPSSALAALDRYYLSHGNGRLSIEATILRAEALVALGRKSEALQYLDGLDLGRVPGAAAGHLERAELREGSGRFEGALADFDWVLAHAKDKGVVESAIAGRMRCRQRMGDIAGAQGDAAEYLRRFPNGRHAREAMAILGAGSPSPHP